MLRARTLAGLTALALCLAGCGAPATEPSAGSAPRFVAPTPARTSESAAAPSEVPSEPPAKSPAASPSVTASASPSTSPSASAPVNVKRVFPVRASNVAYHPTHGKYPATDIFADCGETVVAVTSGVVLEVSTTDRYVKGSPDGPDNGGLSVSLLGDDGVRYYGSHLSRIQSGIRAGVRVTPGQQLGKLGRTGNANNVCHLHFGISPPCAKTGDWKVRRGVIWPASYLTSWRNRGNASPLAKTKAWAKSHNCEA